jgi:hypothetical protein
LFAPLSYFVFLILTIFTLSLAGLLLHSYPTIFFASTHDLLEPDIVSRNGQELLYSYTFPSPEKKRDGPRLSGAQHAIEQVFQSVLSTTESVQSIRVEHEEVLACEGEHIQGLLYTTRGSAVFRNLLRTTVEQFERRFDSETTSGPESQAEFDGTVERLFQFAISG